MSGPPGRIGPFRTGWAVIALRTDAPIVPLAMAGTEELYLGRRMASRVLPATSARALAGLPTGAALPAEGSREELALARTDERRARRPARARPSRRSTRGRSTRRRIRAGCAGASPGCCCAPAASTAMADRG